MSVNIPIMIAWYIHGAGASQQSFAWLRLHLPNSSQCFEYPGDEPVTRVMQRLRSLLAQDGRPAMLIGHSLGGIIAAGCADVASVQRIVTICAPFGGVRHADFLSLFMSHPLFNDLRSYGPVLCHLRANRVAKPHLAIVGSRGLPFLHEDNDGVISVASQTALTGPHYRTVDLNHFEVLLSHDVVDLIRDFASVKE